MTTLTVIDMERFRQRDVVEAAKGLLEAAEAGTIQGLAFVIKVGIGDHRVGTAGIYKRSPEKALQATFALERALMSPLKKPKK